MSMMRMNFHSQLLGKYVDVTVVMPTDRMTLPDELLPKSDGNSPFPKKEIFEFVPGMKFQTIYLMHGGGDDDTLTYRYTNAERFAQEYCVMLVTPNIVNSFGVDTEYGVKYQSFLSKELPLVIQTLFPSSPKREDNFIMGYAMGGNVAIGTALLNPELFGYCVDMSGGIGMTLDQDRLMDELAQDHFTKRMPLYAATFGAGKDLHGSRFDLMKAAKEALAGGNPTPVHVLCGGDEFIRDRVENDVALLRQIEYPVEYTVAPGYTHDFPLWEAYIPIAMRDYLPLKCEPIYPE
ncbi:MAG: hypothetical protein IJ091_01550 [Oscillospiraceae bacterium]|nr:hypothetical protein [Oscillospiraceae bacterium]